MPIIRRLGPPDAAAWFALRLKALEDHPRSFLMSRAEEEASGSEGIAERLGGDPVEFQVLGAFDGETLVGVAGLYRAPRLKIRHRMDVWGVYVAPTHRGQGIGAALVDATIEAARAIPGVDRLVLSVDHDNEPARRLYRSRGFETWGLERDAFRTEGDSVTEEHMALVLAAAPE